MSTPAATPSPAPAAVDLTQEMDIRAFRESKKRVMFWFKTIITLSIWYWSVYRHNVLLLSTVKITQRRGTWLSHNETSLYIKDIRDITTNQSVLGRMLGYGDIQLSSSGGAGSEIRAVGLSDAALLRDLLFDLRDGKIDEQKLQAAIATGTKQKAAQEQSQPQPETPAQHDSTAPAPTDSAE